MEARRGMRSRFSRPRYTIRGLMATILGIAVVLAVLRPVAGLLGSIYPEVEPLIRDIATFDSALVLSCLAIGAYVTLKLMSFDERP